MNGDKDGFTMRTDSLGDELWQRTYNWGPLTDVLATAAPLPNGDLLMAGNRYLNATANSDFSLQRTNSTSTVLRRTGWGAPFVE